MEQDTPNPGHCCGPPCFPLFIPTLSLLFLGFFHGKPSGAIVGEREPNAADQSCFPPSSSFLIFLS